MPKVPKITVLATEELLRELSIAEKAVKASRSPGTKAMPEFHSLIVQVMIARRGVEPVLVAPPASSD